VIVTKFEFKEEGMPRSESMLERATLSVLCVRCRSSDTRIWP